MKKKVVVIGAGAAGLASAFRLQSKGYDVEVFEKDILPGGKMNKISKDGYTFDLGPCIVMMPEIYREVFLQAGRNPEDYISMKRLDPMYSMYFPKYGGQRVDISNDILKITETLEEIYKDDAEGFFQYLSDAYKRYN